MTKLKNHSLKVYYEQLNDKDLSATVELMLKLGYAVAGLYSPEALKFLCKDACGLKKKRPVILIAKKSDEIIGYVIAIINNKPYWYSFLIRHPLIASKIVLKRSIKFCRSAIKSKRLDYTSKKTKNDLEKMNQQFSKYIIKSDSKQITWNDYGPQIAKIQHIAIKNEYRNHGIGANLYRCLFRALIDCGVERVDAIIAFANIPSIKIHAKTGWDIFQMPEHLLATYMFNSSK